MALVSGTHLEGQTPAAGGGHPSLVMVGRRLPVHLIKRERTSRHIGVGSSGSFGYAALLNYIADRTRTVEQVIDHETKRSY